ncbi:NADase-type glycan-binding domain-containing protein [Leptospira idonii]|uniref:NAD glycohydrolase translocation F5/8 type C domain-containing protein n=1 Tax=Leptospira idonii TaxID=1193500 RepID=A0A4R9M254_9LEPT|nr:hypothetical protein [Leptospira idonii]TGN20830.1 hypothetical protein EHS15_01735 [Leptospira idonii]
MKYLLLFLILCKSSLFARDSAFEKLYGSVNHCYNNDCRKVIGSSFLVEKGKPKDEYSPDKLQDFKNKNWKETAWCVSKNQGIGEYVYIPYWNDESKSGYADILKRKDYYVSLTIINGFAKNSDLFIANNRIKKVSIEVQEVAYTMSVAGSETIPGTDVKIKDGPLLNSIHEIEFADTMEQQEFKLKIAPKSRKSEYLEMGLLFKITLKEIYPGTKYKDTCMSAAMIEMIVPADKKK